MPVKLVNLNAPAVPNSVLPIFVTPLPRAKLLRDSQYPNASVPINDTLLGMLMLLRLVQWSNVPL